MAAIPSRPPVPLRITASAFASFATPAITVPFPSAYQQTQIPFAYQATPTWAATRIPTQYGGVAATNGISTALRATGTHYGETGAQGAGHGGWPVWATGVIIGCGVAALLIIISAIWCWCTRGRRFKKRRKIYTEKHVGGGALRAQQSREKRQRGKPPREKSHHTSLAPIAPPEARSRSRSAHREPYPPHISDGRSSPHTPTRTTYPVPLMSGYGRSSTDLPLGYRTSSDGEHPLFVDGTSEYGSPARLWAPSSGGTPRSSLSASRRDWDEDGGTLRSNVSSAKRARTRDIAPPLPTQVNLEDRWERSDRSAYDEYNPLTTPTRPRRARRNSLPTPSSPDLSGGARVMRRPISHDQNADKYERQGLRQQDPRHLYPSSPQMDGSPRFGEAFEPPTQHWQQGPRGGRQPSLYRTSGYGRNSMDRNIY